MNETAWSWQDLYIMDIWACMYDWSAVGVIMRPEGYYLGTDSGCSCYGAFDSYNQQTLDDFTGPMTLDQASEEVLNLWAQEMEEGLAPRSDVDDFLKRLGEAVPHE